MKKKPGMEVNIGGIKMKNPLMVASGTFGYGREYSEVLDINGLGAIVTKTITLKPRAGNPPPRLVETPAGIINSIGLQNVGVEKFIKEKLPYLRQSRTRTIVSIAGNKPGEYVKLAELLDRKGVDGLELNISCPNVKKGNQPGRLFSQDAAETFSLVRKVRKSTKLPLIVKLSPNVTDIAGIAASAARAGADAIALVNTFKAMAVDIEKRKPVISNIVGGLSGPAIKPVAVRMVWEVANTVKIPVIGMGGIMNAADALEFLIAGAKAISIGTGLFVDPQIPSKIIRGIGEYMKKHRFKNIGELSGSLEV